MIIIQLLIECYCDTPTFHGAAPNGFAVIE